MAKAEDVLTQAWSDREGPAVLTTVNKDGQPNSVYVGEMHYRPEIGFIIADNYFHKTRENIKNGSPGSFLFITKEGKAYQVKGGIDYQTEGPAYDIMKASHKPQHPGVAVAVVRVEEVYSGAEKLA